MPQQEGGAAFANSNIVDNLRRSNMNVLNVGAANLDDSLNYLDAKRLSANTNLGQFQNY